MPTKTDSSSFRPAPELIRAAEDLLLAVTFEQHIRPIVVAYENAILEQHQFPPAQEWREHVEHEVILDRKNSFLLSNEDAKTFFAACFAARDAAGLKVSKPDNCPLLEAESARIDCENAFMKALGDLPGLETFKSQNGVMSLEMRAKIVDIGLRLVAPFVANSDEILKRALNV